jgi:hypothetical protein
MKILFFSMMIVLGFSFFGCSTHDDNFYDRANNASEKSLQSLDKDTK